MIEIHVPSASGPPRAGITPDRRPEFDVMRALVVAGLVIFHSAMVFASGVSWFVKTPHPSLGFTVFLVWGSLWGMPLLFVVSGMAARYAMRTRSVAAFARERLARLLVPFVVGLLVRWMRACHGSVFCGLGWSPKSRPWPEAVPGRARAS